MSPSQACPPSEPEFIVSKLQPLWTRTNIPGSMMRTDLPISLAITSSSSCFFLFLFLANLQINHVVELHLLWYMLVVSLVATLHNYSPSYFGLLCFFCVKASPSTILFWIESITQKAFLKPQPSTNSFSASVVSKYIDVETTFQNKKKVHFLKCPVHLKALGIYNLESLIRVIFGRTGGYILIR